MSRYLMPTHYFIPVGQIVDTGVKCEGYPLPFEPDAAGELPRFFGSRKYTGTGTGGYIVTQQYYGNRYDDSLAFGGVSGYNFLRRDCKPGAK